MARRRFRDYATRQRKVEGGVGIAVGLIASAAGPLGAPKWVWIGVLVLGIVLLVHSLAQAWGDYRTQEPAPASDHPTTLRQTAERLHSQVSQGSRCTFLDAPDHDSFRAHHPAASQRIEAWNRDHESSRSALDRYDETLSDAADQAGIDPALCDRKQLHDYAKSWLVALADAGRLDDPPRHFSLGGITNDGFWLQSGTAAIPRGDLSLDDLRHFAARYMGMFWPDFRRW